MKKAAILISIILASAFLFSCHSTIKKVQSSLITVRVSSRTAMLDIRPATPFEKMKRFLARTFSAAVADAAIPAIVQDLRLTVSASDMTTITATVNVVGLSTADFIVEVPNGTQRHFVVEGLDSGANVQYQGDAYADLIGDPVLLTINMVSAGDITPPVFNGVTSVAIASSTSISLSWSSATDNVTSSANMVYLIYASTTPGGENFTAPNYSTPAGATSYAATGLNPGSTYYFVVRAKDEAGNIDSNTVEKSANLPDTLPPTFAGLVSATVLSSTSVQLSWSSATDNFTAQANIVYLIYQATSPSGESYTTSTYTTAAGATSYTVTGLTPGTTYYFVARAKDEAGNIDSNTIERSNTTPDTTPPTFAGLSLISNVTATSMLLSWSAASDAVTPQTNIKYLIYQATSPNGEVYTAPTYSTPPGQTSYLVNGLNLTPGGAYYFVVRAQDAAGNIDGNTVEISGYYPGTYVDVGTGSDQTGCGTLVKPCRTITFVLSEPTFTGNTKIFVAPGIYSSASGTPEVFPLILKTGTALFCYGAGFSTVIDDSAGLGASGIIINDTGGLGGTFIEGCKVNAVLSAAAIDDSGLPMTVNNCSVNGVYPATTGIQLSANSKAMNSVVTGFPGGDGGGVGIRVSADALISGNTLTGNDTGIYSSAGSPTISNNFFSENNYGVYSWDGSATISNNTILNSGGSGNGIVVTGSTSTTSPFISGNTISGSFNGIEVDAGIPSIDSNTMSNNTYGIYAFSGTPTLNNNTITTNIIGIWAANGNAQITGNSISSNTQSGLYISGGATIPVVTGNSMFCNTDFDVNISISATTALDLSNNLWDHAPPSQEVTSTCTAGLGTDMCISGASPTTFTPYTLVTSPCP